MEAYIVSMAIRTLKIGEYARKKHKIIVVLLQ